MCDMLAFLLSEFPNFRWDLERRVTPVCTKNLSSGVVVMKSA
jgi:hypothetical protein